MPGTDHAGIATRRWSKRLLQDEGNAGDYDRDEFVAKVQAFKDSTKPPSPSEG